MPWALLIVAAVLWWAYSGETPVDSAVSLVNALDDASTRGPRLTTTSQADDGQVHVSPDDLAAQAAEVLGRDVATDALILSRVIRSERSKGGSELEAACIGWVCMNDALAHGWSLAYTAIGPDGLCGRQKGWRYASGRDSYQRDLEIAEEILAGDIEDPTGGAQHFVHRLGFATDAEYQAIVKKWGAEGWKPFTLAGTGSLVLFNKG